MTRVEGFEAGARLRVGVIGAGAVSRTIHLPILRRFSDIDLVAVCDVQSSRARQMAAEFEIASVFEDHSELLRVARPDAVFVLTTPTSTAQVARESLLAGVATFIEKPPGMCLTETRDLLAASHTTGAPAMVGFNRRFQPLVREARRLVAERGPLVSALVEFHTYNLDHWRGRLPQSVVANFHIAQTIHALDLLRFLGEEITTVYGKARRHFDEHSDALSALVEFRGGGYGHLISNYTSTVRIERVALHGRRVIVHLEGVPPDQRVPGNPFMHARVWADDLQYDISSAREDPLRAAGFVDEDWYFLDCAREKRQPTPPAGTLEEALKTMELIQSLVQPAPAEVPA